MISLLEGRLPLQSAQNHGNRRQVPPFPPRRFVLKVFGSTVYRHLVGMCRRFNIAGVARQGGSPILRRYLVDTSSILSRHVFETWAAIDRHVGISRRLKVVGCGLGDLSSMFVLVRSQHRAIVGAWGVNRCKTVSHCSDLGVAWRDDAKLATAIPGSSHTCCFRIPCWGFPLEFQNSGMSENSDGSGTQHGPRTTVSEERRRTTNDARSDRRQVSARSLTSMGC